jgi:hypothetical protein
MKYALEIGSGAMIYIARFIKTSSGIHNLIGGNKQTHRQHVGHRRILSFFKNNESRLIKSNAMNGSVSEENTLGRHKHVEGKYKVSYPCNRP